ncbi:MULTISPECIES: VTT domain-containing protein [unclassified Clostridium]|uniref:TVP38/TMEM64 family protein n=1 Tax=unclassified Clostridium TaxID=2614128 RepID=UPI0018979F98|nr:MULTISPECIES: VTT domain-containing protein [unclassified Clostridium]MCR1950349.1 VTT domain-containing protein [Clostridium sp. DSM 100503]
MFNLDNIIILFQKYSMYAIPISILISTIIAILGVVPSIVVTGANIIFFGAFEGFIISVLGETIGGYISFIIYRLGFKKGAENIKNKHRLLKAIVDGEGKNVGFLIFEGRLVPFIPSGFVTLAAAISNVKGFIFITATFLGKIPSIALEALISYDLINIEENFLRLIITLLAILLLYITLKNIKRNKIKG